MLGLFKSSGTKDAGSGEGWLDRLKVGLKATGSRIGGLLSGRSIDESLFEELESALLLADAGSTSKPPSSSRPSLRPFWSSCSSRCRQRSTRTPPGPSSSC
jgi:hypothetical protein